MSVRVYIDCVIVQATISLAASVVYLFWYDCFRKLLHVCIMSMCMYGCSIFTVLVQTYTVRKFRSSQTVRHNQEGFPGIFWYCVEKLKSNVIIFLEKMDWEGVGAVCSVFGMLKPKPRYALSELSVLPLCVVFVCLASFLTCWCCLVSFKQRNLTILSSCVPLGFQRSTVC